MELGSEKDCVAVVVTKAKAVETKLAEEVHKEEKNMSRNADIATVEKQNNSIIHDVINEAEEKNMDNITSKMGDIKEGISNNTAQLEEVFKGKIKELNATIQSFKEEPTPKSEAVIGLPIINNWPDSERVEYDQSEKDDLDEEESIFQTTDLRDGPDHKGSPNTEIVGSQKNQNMTNSKANISVRKMETTNRNDKSSEEGAPSEVYFIKPSNQQKESFSNPADFAPLFEDAPLWIPENATNAYESSLQESKNELEGTTRPTTNTPRAVSIPSSVYPMTLNPEATLRNVTSDSLNLLTNISGENPESATLVPAEFKSNTTTTTTTTTTSSKFPTSAGYPMTPSSSVDLNDESSNSEGPTLPLIDSTTSSGNLNQSTAASSTISYPWERGSCDDGQVECWEGGCIGKVNDIKSQIICYGKV